MWQRLYKRAKEKRPREYDDEERATTRLGGKALSRWGRARELWAFRVLCERVDPKAKFRNPLVRSALWGYGDVAAEYVPSELGGLSRTDKAAWEALGLAKPWIKMWDARKS